MIRKVKKQSRGSKLEDGQGVNLVRVIGKEEAKDFDPILLLDSFDSRNPSDYVAGFPMHPHRGIETISYIYKGNMVHKDSLGNKDGITDGEVQWMNSGSGIFHEEMLPETERLLGVQLWLNIAAKDKFSQPTYQSIKRDEIEEIEFDGGMLRLLSGKYMNHQGFQGNHQPVDYYDIHLKEDAQFIMDTGYDASIMLFTLLGDIYIGDQLIKEKTAVKLTEGDKVEIKTKGARAQVLYIQSVSLNEPIAWAGPIVMNTREELRQASKDLRKDTFIKERIDY